MPLFKSIVTVCWEFESDPASAAVKAKSLVDGVLKPDPKGVDYQGYSVQTEVVVLKDRVSNVRSLREYSPEQVFAWVDSGEESKTIRVGSEAFVVRLNSDRYQVFKNNPYCVACGIRGVKFVLETLPGVSTAHFNFYAEEDGLDVLMTKDHIKAKSYGGRNSLDNFSTACSLCNQIKASYPIGYEAVRVLREMMRNKDRLPARELKRRVNEARLSMMVCLNGQ